MLFHPLNFIHFLRNENHHILEIIEYLIHTFVLHFHNRSSWEDFGFEVNGKCNKSQIKSVRYNTVRNKIVWFFRSLHYFLWIGTKTRFFKYPNFPTKKLVMYQNRFLQYKLWNRIFVEERDSKYFIKWFFIALSGCRCLKHLWENYRTYCSSTYTLLLYIYDYLVNLSNN